MVIRSKQKLNISKPFNIVLVNPEIPPNTGNIARLCAATNTKLHLVHPLGFEIDDSKLKRAGLDYWHLLDIQEYKNWDEFLISKFETECHSRENGNPEKSIEGKLLDSHFRGNDNMSNLCFLSTRGEKNIWDIDFNPGDYLIFGSETKGLDEKILEDPRNKENIISIPMNGKTRSLNLSTAVGIVLYEAMRQVTVEKKLFEILPI